MLYEPSPSTAARSMESRSGAVPAAVTPLWSCDWMFNPACLAAIGGSRRGEARLLGSPGSCDWVRRRASRPRQAGIGGEGCLGYGRRRRGSKMAEESAGGGGVRRGAAADRDRDRDDEGAMATERGPGAAYHMFVLMEDLLDKLKLLSYEEEALRRHNMRPLSRCPSPAPAGGGARGRGRLHA